VTKKPTSKPKSRKRGEATAPQIYKHEEDKLLLRPDVGFQPQVVVSDFGLIDAIESGLVKRPQPPVQDMTGHAYFNVWKWIVDTATWEQTTAFYLDSDPHVVAFVKNASLGFSIPYMWRSSAHEYQPDFLARLRLDDKEVGTLILETKGYDPRTVVKIAAAQRWVDAVNRHGRHGRWAYRIVTDPTTTREVLRHAARELASPLPLPWRVTLQRFVAGVRAAYGSRLERVVLYGSRARGDAELDSDIDALVVLDECADFWAEQRRIGGIAVQASEGAGTIVSAMPIGRRDFEDRQTPLLLNVRREGVEAG
jgi:predicted nucleotidyltransferase